MDESGDRGWSGKSSPVFILAALLVPDHLDGQLRAVRSQLCSDLGKPTATVLHWRENIKNHSQRKYVAKTLALEQITLIYVVIDKASFGNNPGGLLDHARMYNYAIRRLLERISWFLRDNGAIGHIALAQITNFKYGTLRFYLEILQNQQTSIAWQSLALPLKIHPTKDRVLLQLADIAAGILGTALWPDDFGAVESAY
ncbi:MAG TPA: DUF3800 domain-containing protein, partial [Acidimicrobiales bacterium]|nr:DUF3800 domain-containing protein [Acidimicrobiales bacterium]